MRKSTLLILLLVHGLCLAQPIRCDRFNINVSRNGDKLLISLDTDLPDTTRVMVHVSRSYWTGSPAEEYPLHYFADGSTVRDWRNAHSIDISHGVWRQKQQERLRLLAAAGEHATFKKIAEEIAVSFTVPIGQADSRFGKNNVNLIGTRVAAQGLHVVSSEVKLKYPLNAGSSTPQVEFENPRELKPAVTYQLSREIPLMPARNLEDVVVGTTVKKLPAGTRIIALTVDRSDTNPWYRVRATTASGALLGTGWVNSIALVGQDITVVRPQKTGER